MLKKPLVSVVVALGLLALPQAALAAPPNADFIFEPSTPAVGEDITFSSTSSDADAPLDPALQTWDFNADGQFGDAVGSSVRHRFAAPGTFPVSLRVTDSEGQSAVATRNVTVTSNPPNASFTTSPANALSGQTVTFDGSASTAPSGETIATTTWDLDGDGAFDDANGRTASKIYEQPGPRTVSLRVQSSGGGVDIASSVITIGNRSPIARFRLSPKRPAAGDAVELISTAFDPDGPIASQKWDLDGDGDFDDAEGPTAETVFEDSGKHKVGLLVEDASGATGRVTDAVSVGAPELPLLSPFPVVRLSGSVDETGRTDITRLSVTAPRGSKVTVRCGGRTCPFSERVTQVERGHVRINAIERKLNRRVEIEVYVTQPDRTGKFASFNLRGDKPPKRTDACVAGELLEPVRCP